MDTEALRRARSLILTRGGPPDLLEHLQAEIARTGEGVAEKAGATATQSVKPARQMQDEPIPQGDDLYWYQLQVVRGTAVSSLTDDPQYIDRVQDLITRLRAAASKRESSLLGVDHFALANAVIAMLVGEYGIDTAMAERMPVAAAIALIARVPAAQPDATVATADQIAPQRSKSGKKPKVLVTLFRLFNTIVSHPLISGLIVIFVGGLFTTWYYNRIGINLMDPSSNKVSTPKATQPTGSSLSPQKNLSVIETGSRDRNGVAASISIDE